MSLRIRKFTFVLTLVFLLVFSSVSWADVEFHNIPTSNACAYPWVLTLVGCPNWLPPGGATVLNCRETLIITPLGIYFGPAAIIDQPRICVFHSCNLLTITLTCYYPGEDGKLMKKEEFKLKKTEMDLEKMK